MMTEKRMQAITALFVELADRIGIDDFYIVFKEKSGAGVIHRLKDDAIIAEIHKGTVEIFNGLGEVLFKKDQRTKG